MIEHYHIVKLTVPTVDFDNGSPLKFAGGTMPAVTDKTYSFTDTALILPISDVFKCINGDNGVSETTPKLKAGLGVASRATATISLKDFIDDPNTDSPNLIANPALAQQGTFFAKLNKRQILTNKVVLVEYWKLEGGVHTLLKTNNYISTKMKRNKKDVWSLECKDILYKTDESKSTFPRLLTGKLDSSITDVSTSITFAGDVADWSAGINIAVVGSDLLKISSVAGSSSSVTLTVTRSTTVTIGSRSFTNAPEDHAAGDEVFRGRIYENAHLADVITDIWTDADIAASFYNKTEIETELDTWLANYTNKVDAIYYEANESIGVLDNICSTFLLDIWADPSDGKLKVRATSPWLTTAAVLTEGEEITYGTLKEDSPEKLQFSRSYLLYNKNKLTESDDDVQFIRSALAKNTELEGEEFYDEKTYKKLAKSLILSDTSESDEIAETNTIRFTQRFSRSPKVYTSEVEEKNLTFGLADVVELISDDLQDESGARDLSIRAQVVQISPKNKIGRSYTITAITYNPFSGSAGSGDRIITDLFDINLFIQAGSPSSADTFNFIFDSASYGQNSDTQAIEVGSFPSGSIVNIVNLNGTISTAKGGDSGFGDSGDGEDGGICLVGKTGVTVNVYLNGNTGDLGNGSYSSNGFLYAPGGGGGGKTLIFGPATTDVQGGGGAGFLPGDGELNGSLLVGGVATFVGAGDGGDIAQDGANGDSSLGGLKGKAIVLNGGTINVLTNGDTARFKQGSGDAPSSLT